MTEQEQYHYDELLARLKVYGLDPEQNCTLEVRELPDIACWVVEISVGRETLLYELGTTCESTLFQAWQELATVASVQHDIRI